MNSYMFDTMIVNRIVDGVLDISSLLGKAKLYATHIQLDELQNTPDFGRRQKLLAAFARVTDGPIPTESLVLDVSRLGQARLGGGPMVETESAVYGVSKCGMAKWTRPASLYEALRQRLNELNSDKPNNIQDALIGETAIVNGMVLVSDDGALLTVVQEFGGKAINRVRQRNLWVDFGRSTGVEWLRNR